MEGKERILSCPLKLIGKCYFEKTKEVGGKVLRGTYTGDKEITLETIYEAAILMYKLIILYEYIFK